MSKSDTICGIIFFIIFVLPTIIIIRNAIYYHIHQDEIAEKRQNIIDQNNQHENQTISISPEEVSAGFLITLQIHNLTKDVYYLVKIQNKENQTIWNNSIIAGEKNYLQLTPKEIDGNLIVNIYQNNTLLYSQEIKTKKINNFDSIVQIEILLFVIAIILIVCSILLVIKSIRKKEYCNLESDF